MSTLAQSATLVAATLATGMTAGLFYSYACSVMPGLRRTDDHTVVTAMRAINVAILNGWFALGFGGALLFTIVTAVLHAPGDEPAFPWILAALAGYLTTLGITGRVSVPLNYRLDVATIETEADLAAARTDFESGWNRWNLARTLTSTAAFGCLIVALLVGR